MNITDAIEYLKSHDDFDFHKKDGDVSDQEIEALEKTIRLIIPEDAIFIMKEYGAIGAEYVNAFSFRHPEKGYKISELQYIGGSIKNIAADDAVFRKTHVLNRDMIVSGGADGGHEFLLLCCEEATYGHVFIWWGVKGPGSNDQLAEPVFLSPSLGDFLGTLQPREAL